MGRTLVYQRQNAPIILFILFPTKWVAYRTKGQRPRIMILIRSYRMNSQIFDGFFPPNGQKNISGRKKSVKTAC